MIASDLTTKVIDEEFLLKLGQEAAQDKITQLRSEEVVEAPVEPTEVQVVEGASEEELAINS